MLEVKTVSLAQFNFSNEYSAKSLDIHTLAKGDIADRFIDYEVKMNQELAQSFFTNETFAQVFQWNITQEMIDYYAHYPEQFSKLNEMPGKTSTSKQVSDSSRPSLF
jgi:hypothetical protein